MNGFLVGLALLVGSGVAAAEPAAQDTDASLTVDVVHVAGTVESIRGVRFPAPPEAARAALPARRTAVERRLATLLAPERLEARGRAWADLGLGGAETPRSILALLYDDLGVVLFDPATRRVLIDPALFSAEDLAFTEQEDAAASVLMATGVRPEEPVVAHGLVHALRAARGRDAVRVTTDGMLAAAAWAEGEANLLALLYLFEGLGIQRQVIESARDPGEFLDGRLLPVSLADGYGLEGSFLDFAFREGFAQTVARYRAGGWRGVEAAAAARQTCRDVLHPDRSPLNLLAPKEPAAPDGFALADHDALGEEAIVILVSALTGKDNLGLIAADGWAGDDLYRFEPKGDAAARGGVTVWNTRWSSPEKAADFEYGWVRGLQARFPGKEAPGLAPGSHLVVSDGRAYRSRRTGSEVKVRIAAVEIDRVWDKEPPPPPAKKQTK